LYLADALGNPPGPEDFVAPTGFATWPTFTHDAQDSLIAVRSTSGLIGNSTRDQAGNLSRLVLTDVGDSVLFAGDYQFDG
jgi:hypothetical protein